MSRPITENGSAPAWLRAEVLVAGAATIWIVFLHSLFLSNAGPLWRDEVGTIDFASMPSLADIWQNLHYDNFPPLFVGVARLWTLAGLNTDYSYRVLGFLIGMATLVILWFGARSFGARVPLLALALYSVNPLAVRVADSMRPYGVGIAFNLLLMALMWRFVQSPRPRTLFLATLAAIFSVQSLYQNAIFVAAFSVAAWSVTLARKQWKTAAQTLVIGGVAAVSLLPHWGNIKQGQDWLVVVWRPVNFGNIWNALLGALDTPVAFGDWIWAALALASVVAAIYYVKRSASWNLLFCAVALLAGTLFHLLFLRALGMMPQTWYFLILLAPAALSIDAILAAVDFPAFRFGRAIASIIIIFLCAGTSVRMACWRQSNMDLVAGGLKQLAQPQDMILVSPWYYGVSLQRYYGTNGLTPIPPMDELRIHRYDLLKKQMASQNPIGPLLESARLTLRSGHAVWVVGNFQPPPNGQLPPVLPPYTERIERAESTYLSSWTAQISQLLQTHATNSSWAEISIPGGATVNPLEDVPLMVFRGWKEP